MEGYGKRILIVAQDAGRRSLLEAELGSQGYAIQTVVDAFAAIAEMQKRRFDAVIADFPMAGLSTVEFMTCLRMFWPDTPVLLYEPMKDSLSVRHDEIGHEQAIESAGTLLSRIQLATARQSLCSVSSRS
jgi:DNA-binding NtrC family response regulator